jgi:hypothetical protein
VIVTPHPPIAGNPQSHVVWWVCLGDGPQTLVVCWGYIGGPVGTIGRCWSGGSGPVGLHCHKNVCIWPRNGLPTPQGPPPAIPTAPPPPNGPADPYYPQALSHHPRLASIPTQPRLLHSFPQSSRLTLFPPSPPSPAEWNAVASNSPSRSDPLTFSSPVLYVKPTIPQ